MKAYIFILSFVICGLVSTPSFAGFDTKRVRLKLKSAEHLGAHGFGYNESSLQELSKSLDAEDTPALIEMLKEQDGMSVGASFGLAALCKPGLDAVKNAVLANGPTSIEMEARDTIDKIVSFKGCDQAVKDEAGAFLTELDKRLAQRLVDAQAKNEAMQKEDQRINEIGLKMLDPAQKDKLTKQEREEAFNRSVKALGMDGPRTPDQETLYRKMYQSMVEGK